MAERVRHWRGLVEDLEGNVPVDAGVYATELGCRDLIMKYLGQMPPRLHDRLMIDLVEPLDMRFEAVTVDDGGAALADRVRIGDLTDRG